MDGSYYMATLSVKLDKSSVFYFHLLNLYSCDETKINQDYRRRYTKLRSESFFREFEKLEKPWVEHSILGKKTDRKLLELEEKKFDKIWKALEKEGENLKHRLEAGREGTEALINRAIEISGLKYDDEIMVYIVPNLKAHGMQGDENQIFIGCKNLSDADYEFLLFHECLHIILRKTMNRFYFKHGYSEDLQLAEETAINYLYHRALGTEEKLLPRWMYLKNDRHYGVFVKLLGDYEEINDLKGFMARAVKKLL